MSHGERRANEQSETQLLSHIFVLKYCKLLQNSNHPGDFRIPVTFQFNSDGS